MPRYAKKVDANQAAVVALLRASGWDVYHTHAVGMGFPDLVIGKAGHTYLMEVKGVNHRFTPSEEDFIEGWGGSSVIVAFSPKQALERAELALALEGGNFMLGKKGIMIDGPRCVGKTTAVAAIISKLEGAGVECQRVKRARPQDVITDIWDAVADVRMGKGFFVFDRSHLTELVMSTALDRVANLSQLYDDIAEADEAFADAGLARVLLTANGSVIRSRLKARPNGRGQDAPDSTHSLWLSFVQDLGTYPTKKNGWLVMPHNTKHDTERLVDFALGLAKGRLQWR